MKYVIALEVPEGQMWIAGTQLLYAGEIQNMKGSGVYFLDHKLYHGYHIDSFFEYENIHYGEYCFSDFLVKDIPYNIGRSCLSKNLLKLLIELNKSHMPSDAEKSFVMQATKIVYGQ